MSTVDRAALAHELEWRACSNDFLYFLKNYWRIKIIEHVPGEKPGPKLIKPWEAQTEIAKTYAARDKDGKPLHDQIVSLKARQLGWTTVTTAYAFWTAYFTEWLPWLFVSQNEDKSIQNLGMVAFGYARLPEWMRKRGPVLERNTTELMEWSNGSRIESIPATGTSGRGDAVWGVMWDEAAFAPDPAAMYGALEPLCYGQMILLSTANGMGDLFHDTWLDSQLSDSPWKGQFWPWWSRPDRDEKWYKKQERKFKGQSWLLHQEYPRDPIEAFAKSGRVVLDFALLDDYVWEEPLYGHGWDFGKKVFKDEELERDKWAEEEILLEVWEYPTVFRDETGRAHQAPNYTIAADIAEGLSYGDATYVTVYDSNTRRCVARIRTNYSADEIPDVLNELGRWYFNALLGVERNNHGWGIIHALTRYKRYPRLYRMEQIARIVQGDRTQTFGWHTNNGTKPKMVQDFVREMRAHGIEPLDPTLRHELNTFVQHDNGSYSANPPHHDDGVMSHMINLQIINDVGQYPVLWDDDMTARAPTMGELDKLVDGMKFKTADRLPIGWEETPAGATLPSFWVAPTRS